jgi:hypothetical protein
MTKRGIGNVPDGVPLAWSVDKAAKEFGLTGYLCRKRLKDGKEEPDSEGCYTTAQLTRVIWKFAHGAVAPNPGTSGSVPTRERNHAGSVFE